MNYLATLATGIFALGAMTGCTGFRGQRLFGRAPASLKNASLTTQSVNINCGQTQVAANGKCYSVRTMDITTQQVGFAQQSYQTFANPAANVGFVGLKGTLALDLDSPNVFTEALVEVGYADSCDVGTFPFQSYADFSAHLTNFNFLGAHIIKTNLAGHAEVSVNYTLPAPIKAGGCFFVDYAGDSWSQAGANQSPSITMTNALAVKYIDAGSDLNQSALSMHEEYGPGGEFCVGLCDNNFNASTTPMAAGMAVTRVTESFTLKGIVGTVANGPFAADGRYTPAAETGDWSTENIWYLDPQCSSSVPGFSGLLNQVPDVPANAVLLMDLKLGGNGANSMVNKFVNQTLNQSVNAGDCLVAVFSGTSNAVLDLESQLSAITDNAANTTAGTVHASPAARAPASVPNALAASTPTATSTTTAQTPPGSIAVGAVVAAPSPAPVPVVPAAAPAVAGTTAPVYRFFSNEGKHLYALRTDAYDPSQASLEGVEFNVYTASDPSLTALYRCSAGDQHFLSVDPGCEGARVGPLLGYVSAAPTVATTPLYRYDLNGDWLEVVDPNEGNQSGYNNPTLLAYAPR